MYVKHRTNKTESRQVKLAKQQRRRNEIKNNLFFFGLSAPGIIALIMFSYIPMAGLYMVFTKYNFQDGIFGSEFVGLQNFKFFFMNMDTALRATRNTLVINLISMVLCPAKWKQGAETLKPSIDLVGKI